MKTYFVVSDVHSFYIEMVHALLKQGFDASNPEHIVVVCGDAFDRGPDTVKMFEFLKEMYEEKRLIYIRGNHEDLLFNCMYEIMNGHIPSYHHFTNGTVRTICDLCGYSNENIITHISEDRKWDIYERLNPLLEFITKATVNYWETDHYIFVHGWVPCTTPDTNIYHARKKFGTVDPVWNQSEDPLYDGAWKAARWINGMEAWNQGCKIEGKTIVMGHWHCSWGWSHLRMERKEFPQKNRKDWEKSFEPFADEGILAIDACTAVTGKVNCVVIEESDL